VCLCVLYMYAVCEEQVEGLLERSLQMFRYCFLFCVCVLYMYAAGRGFVGKIVADVQVLILCVCARACVVKFHTYICCV
jgi:hypothetical protein